MLTEFVCIAENRLTACQTQNYNNLYQHHLLLWEIMYLNLRNKIREQGSTITLRYKVDDNYSNYSRLSYV